MRFQSQGWHENEVDVSFSNGISNMATLIAGAPSLALA